MLPAVFVLKTSPVQQGAVVEALTGFLQVSTRRSEVWFSCRKYYFHCLVLGIFLRFLNLQCVFMD